MASKIQIKKVKNLFLSKDNGYDNKWTLSDLKEHCKDSIENATVNQLFEFMINTGNIVVDINYER